jgi:hypothetical protein
MLPPYRPGDAVMQEYRATKELLQPHAYQFSSCLLDPVSSCGSLGAGSTPGVTAVDAVTY